VKTNPLGVSSGYYVAAATTASLTNGASAGLAVTGNSYICFAVNVLGAAGADAYLGKYLSKQTEYRDSLEAIGWTRRWSSSRSWPRGRGGYRGTIEKLWHSTQMVGRDALTVDKRKQLESVLEPPKNHYLFERVGTDSYLDFERRLERRRMKAKIGGLYEIVRTENRSEDASSRE